MHYFRIIFLEEADKFITELPPKAVKKLFYNLDIAEQTNDSRLFKKLQDEIWELRVRNGNIQIRLLAFWDKTNNADTLVVSTHGFVKKVDKIPDKEIERAKNIRKKYFDHKK